MRDIARMRQLEVSNGLLSDGVALGSRLAADGYLFLRGVLDPNVIRQAKHRVMSWFQNKQLIDVVDDEPVWLGEDLSWMGFGTEDLRATRTWEWLATRPMWTDLFRHVLGEPGVVLPIGEYVFTWPGKANTWSGIHQDGQASAGMEFLVFWVPLMRVTDEIGGLTIAPGMHKAGSLTPNRPGAGPTDSVMLPADSIPPESWAWAEYRPGDLLIFDRYTPHCGLPNTSTCLRLSIDFRVRRQSSYKPVVGVVVAEDPGGITIAADDGGEIRLRVDDATVRRDYRQPGNPATGGSYLGRRVIAVANDGRASLVRTPRGYLGPNA